MCKSNHAYTWGNWYLKTDVFIELLSSFAGAFWFLLGVYVLEIKVMSKKCCKYSTVLCFQPYYMPNKIILICIWIRSLHFLVQFSYIFSPYGIRVTIHLLILTEGFIGIKSDKGILLCSILLQDVCITYRNVFEVWSGCKHYLLRLSHYKCSHWSRSFAALTSVP